MGCECGLTRETCAGALLDLLPGLMRFVRHHMRSRRAPGLSVPQFRTLVQLYRRPATSLSVVAEALGTTAPATSRMVSGLVRKGLVVRRESSSDRRQVSLALTARGEVTMKAAWSGTQKVLAERLTGVPGPQLHALGLGLQSLLTIFGPIAAADASTDAAIPGKRVVPGQRGRRASRTGVRD